MNKQSNAYIVIYATVMVIIVALVLSFVSLKLKPLQQQNVETEKRSDILRSVGLMQEITGDYNEGVKDLYSKYIVKSLLVNTKGDVVSEDSKKAFDALVGLRNILALPTADQVLPIFVSKNDSGELRYIFPVDGVGLWGPIWGFVALKDNFDTIAGVVIGHASETPGLGAEIAAPAFQNQFIDKQLFSNDTYVGIKVLKGEGSSKGNQNAVDAITGGTITSVAVEDMFTVCLGSGYKSYIEKMRNELSAPAVVETVLTGTIVVEEEK